MNLNNLINQLLSSQNPMSMIMGMLPNQNLKEDFSNLASSNNDNERAEILAKICNNNGITKSQLAEALKNSNRL